MIPFFPKTFVLKGTIYTKNLEIIADPKNPNGLAVQFLDRGNKRFMWLGLANEAFVISSPIMNGAHIEQRYTIGALPSNYYLKIIKTGLHASRSEFLPTTPWVFSGTAGYGYGF